MAANNFSTTVSGVIEDGGQASGTGGSIIKVGTGTLTLLGDNTYSGGTTIQAGTLVAGTVSAAQEISFALGTGNVFLQGGTLRTPSLDPLTINVGGNYTQSPGGTLALGVAGVNGEDYDHVQVGGIASLNGTLAVSSLNNFRPSNGNAFEVLRTNGTRSGEFAHVNDSLNNNPNLQRIDVYAPNGVALVYLASGPAPTPSPTPKPKPPIIDVIPNPLPPINPEEPLPLPELLSILDPTAQQLTSLFEITFREPTRKDLIWRTALRRSREAQRDLFRSSPLRHLPTKVNGAWLTRNLSSRNNPYFSPQRKTAGACR